jgi:hypothetical protein
MRVEAAWLCAPVFAWNTSEIGSTPSEVSLRVFAVRADVCSVKPTERSSRQRLNAVKRTIKRFAVNG